MLNQLWLKLPFLKPARLDWEPWYLPLLRAHAQADNPYMEIAQALARELDMKRVLVPREGRCNVMSVSLLRLQDVQASTLTRNLDRLEQAGLLRREPEVFPVFWQGILRTERVLLAKERRFAKRLRRRFRKARR